MRLNSGEVLRTLASVIGFNISIWLLITVTMLIWPLTKSHFCKEFKPDSNVTKIYFTINRPVQKVSCWLAGKPD